jgi:hypothetical protein
VHATRTALRLKELLVEDGRGVLRSARRVMPYLPAVARWAASEGLGMVPAITQNLEKNVKQWLTPTPEQQAEISRAEGAEVQAQPGVVKLRKKKPLATSAQPSAAASA